MNLGLVVAAAGGSTRFGKDKLSAPLGDSTVLSITLKRLRSVCCLKNIPLIVVVPPRGTEIFQKTHADALSNASAQIVEGSKKSRSRSVQNGVKALPPEVTHVIIHDAARPMINEQLIERIVNALTKYDAVISAKPIIETLKKVDADSPDHVLETVPRELYRLIQTPQGFLRSLLEEGGDAFPELSPTDEAGFIEALEKEVKIVEGDSMNIKVTRASDLDLLNYFVNF